MYRQNIEIALNRGESYHQLDGAISYVNGGKIIAKTEREQLIFKESSRLISNIILYYNSYILSQFYLQKLKENNVNQITALKRISPIAWVNINFHGKYDLQKMSAHMSLNSLMELIKNETLIDDQDEISEKQAGE